MSRKCDAAWDESKSSFHWHVRQRPGAADLSSYSCIIANAGRAVLTKTTNDHTHAIKGENVRGAFMRFHAGPTAQRVPLARMAEAEDIAAAIVYLESPAASFATGALSMVDGHWGSLVLRWPSLLVGHPQQRRT